MDVTDSFHDATDGATSVIRSCTYNDAQTVSEFQIQKHDHVHVSAADDNTSNYEELDFRPRVSMGILQESDLVQPEYASEYQDMSDIPNDVVVIEDSDTDTDLGITDSSDDDIEPLYLAGSPAESYNNEIMDVSVDNVNVANVDCATQSSSILVTMTNTVPNSVGQNTTVKIQDAIDCSFSDVGIVKCEPTSSTMNYETIMHLSDICYDTDLTRVQTVTCKQEPTKIIHETDNPCDMDSSFNMIKSEPYEVMVDTTETEKCGNFMETSDDSMTNAFASSGASSTFVVNETFEVEYESMVDRLDTIEQLDDDNITVNGKATVFEKHVPEIANIGHSLEPVMKSDSTDDPIMATPMVTSNNETSDRTTKYQDVVALLRNPADVKFTAVELCFYFLDLFSSNEKVLVGMFVKQTIGNKTSNKQDSYEYICSNKHNGISCNRIFTSCNCFLNHCFCKYSRGFYACPVCEMKIRNCEELDIHLKGHNIWLHTCARCNYGFADKDSLQAHELHCSSTKRSGPSQYSRYVCELCNELHKLPKDLYASANLDEAILPHLLHVTKDDCYEIEQLYCLLGINSCDSDYCQTDERQCLPGEESEDSVDNDEDVDVEAYVDVDVEAYVDVEEETSLFEENLSGNTHTRIQTNSKSRKTISSSGVASTTDANAPNREAYVMYIQTGVVDNKYMCSECKKLFELFNCCKNHIAECHRNRGYSCIVCGFKVDSFTDLASHLVYHDIWVYTCRFCKYGFSTVNELSKHESICYSTPKGVKLGINTGPSLYFLHVCTTCQSLHKIGGSLTPTARSDHKWQKIFPYTEHSYIASPWTVSGRYHARDISVKVPNIENTIVYLKVVYTRTECAVSISYLQENTLQRRKHCVELTTTGQKIPHHSRDVLALAKTVNLDDKVASPKRPKKSKSQSNTKKTCKKRLKKSSQKCTHSGSESHGNWIVVVPDKRLLSKVKNSRGCVCISKREMKVLLSANALAEIEYKHNSHADEMIRLPTVVVGLDDIGPYLDNGGGMTMSGHIEPSTSDNCIRLGHLYVCKLCGCSFKVNSCFSSHILKSHNEQPHIKVIDGLSVLLYSCSACSLVFDCREDVVDHCSRRNCTLQIMQQRCSVCNNFHVQLPSVHEDDG